jgi:NADH dehydrogenase
VAIVGAGFGGLWAARTLARPPVEVLLIDRNNHHTFLPLLYQVAAAELKPKDIAHEVREGMQGATGCRYCTIHTDPVKIEGSSVDTKTVGQVETAEGPIARDSDP